MTAVNDALCVLVPMAYLVAVAYHRSASLDDRKAWRRVPALLVALGAHALLVGVRFAALGHLPLSTLFDVFSVLGLLVTVTYAIVALIVRIQTTGADVLVLPLGFATLACACGGRIPEPTEKLATLSFILHTVPAVGAVASVLVSGVYGLLWLRLSAQIRRKQFDGLFRRLPDLEVLATMNFRSAVIGFLLATAGIGYGATLYADRFDRVDVTEPKISVTLFVWTVLLLMTGGKLVRRLSDRAAAIVAVIASAIILISLMVGVLALVTFPLAG